MRRIKRALIALMLVLAMTAVTGCGGMSAEEAKDYAQAVLDASYKGEFKDYIKITDSSEEEAQEMYEGNIDMTMEASGFTQMGLSEEMLADYHQLFLDLAKQAKYSVGEAKETDNGFEIPVTVEPFGGMEDLETELTDLLMEKIKGIDGTPSEEELNELTMQTMYDLVAEKIQNPEYGEAQTVTIHVTKDSDNVYFIPDNEMTELDDAMFPMV